MHRAFRHCKGCTKRYPGCHSKCGYYKDDLDEWQKMKDYLNADKEIESYLDASKHTYMDRLAKGEN